MRDHHVFRSRPGLVPLGLLCALALAAPAFANPNPIRERCHEELEQLRQKAQAGDAQAQTELGICHEQGWGLPNDERRAVELYRRAAEQGNADAQYKLGAMYYFGKGGLPKDERRALELYRRAAEQGNANGQRALGGMYETGRGGLPKDERRAVELYRNSL